LDKFIETIIKKKTEENKNCKPTKANTQYQKLTREIKRIREKQTGNYKTDRELRILIRKKVKERRKLRSTIPNPDFVKVAYVRYADD
jgi:hypothetical protein